MSIRVSPRTHRSAVALAGLIVAAVGLSGCSSLGSRTFGDSTVTGSVAQSAPATINQPMPASLGAPNAVLVAEQQFLPPANVGGGSVGGWNGGGNLPPSPVQNSFAQPIGATSPIGTAAIAPSVQSQDLPALGASSPMGATQAMPAQQTLAPMPAAPAVVALGATSPNAALPVNSSIPVAAPAANANGYRHTIAGGESLYTIARKYDVTTQAIVQANNLSSPDKIVVGQQVIIPGRGDLVRAPAAPTVAPVTQVATAAPAMTDMALPGSRPAGLAPGPQALGTTPSAAVTTPAVAPAPVQAAPAQAAPVQVATAPAPAAEPVMSGSDKFRWPASGRVITDFAASRGTGINIDVPEGSSVKAAENGTVIYVGSGVEGYGNLILIRHPNGYVSAYAHLKDMGGAKGAAVNRGDNIGTVGQTGSVSRPQLHFELRKGATPVDPVPLLAS